MTTPAEALTSLSDLLRPWRRRIVMLVLSWLGIVLAGAALGLRANATYVATALLAIAAVAWYTLDHTSSQHITVWPLVDGDLSQGSRGNDFRVANLAGRLQAANSSGDGRPDLVRDLHEQLSDIIRERLYAKHGLVVEEEPKWSEGVTPPELWALIVGLPPADLYKPAQLDQYLRRIEQW